MTPPLINPRGAISSALERSARQWTAAKTIRLLRFLAVMGLGMALGAVSLALFSAGIIYDYEDTVKGDTLPDVEVIVCLAGARGRIPVAAEVWHRYFKLSQVQGGRVPILYISGMGPAADRRVLESNVSKDVFQALGTEHVLLETKSTDTAENAAWLAEYAVKNGWRRILLVTSAYHMKRARYVFARVLRQSLDRAEADDIEASAGLPRRFRIETMTVPQEPFRAESWRESLYGIRVTLSEFIKWIYYRLYW